LKVPKFRREAPATGEGSQPRRRRRRVRPDAPTTIVPIVGDGETPSWLHTDVPAPAAAAAAKRPATPLALDLDAARERLRRQIPPVQDDH
jgi:hypothetical protein